MKKPTAHKPTVTSLIQPLGDRVLITARVAVTKERKSGDLYLPETAEKQNDPDPFFIATVLGVGEDCKRVKIGDRVVIDGPHSFRVWTEGIDVCMIREQNIVAVLK